MLSVDIFCVLFDSFGPGVYWFLMSRILSWNVRGLNDPSKRNVVRAVVSSLRNVVVCLHESKVSYVFCSILRCIGGSFINKCVFLEATGATGGVITAWNSRFFIGREVIVSKFFITVQLLSVKCGSVFFVTNVYGPSAWDGKEEFFTELINLKELCEGKWIICGDFNCTRGQEERRGKTWSSKATSLFNSMINELAMIDPPHGESVLYVV